MSRSRRSNNQVSLFPFLAVLVCAMGALIFLLIVTTRQIREDAIARAQQPATDERSDERSEPASPPESESGQSHADELIAAAGPAHTLVLPGEPPVSVAPVQRLADLPLNPLFAAEPVPADPDAPLRSILSSLSAKRDRTKRQVIKTARTLEQERARITELRREHQRLTAELEAQVQQHTLDKQKAAELAAAQSEIAGQIARARSELEQQRHNRPLVPSRFAFVPFDGRTGTTLRPILIECTGQGLRFQPEDVLLTEDDLKGFSFTLNPLLLGTQSLVEFWSDPQNVASAEERGRKPYVLLIVRPSGTTSFYAARALLQKLDRPFGYELVEEDWEFAPPELNTHARQRLRSTIDELLAQRQLVIDSALAGRESGSLSPGGRRMRFTPGGGFEEVDEHGEAVVGGGERLGMRRTPGSSRGDGTGRTSGQTPWIASSTPPISRPISNSQRSMANDSGAGGRSPRGTAESAAPPTRWSQVPDVPDERRLPVIAGGTPTNRPSSPNSQGRSDTGAGTGRGHTSPFAGGNEAAQGQPADRRISSAQPGTASGGSATNSESTGSDAPRLLTGNAAPDATGWRGSDRRGAAGGDPVAGTVASNDFTRSPEGEQSPSIGQPGGTEWSTADASPVDRSSPGAGNGRSAERQGTERGTGTGQSAATPRREESFDPARAASGGNRGGGTTDGGESAPSRDQFADRGSATEPLLLPEFPGNRNGDASAGGTASSRATSSRTPQSSGQASGGSGGSSMQFPSESGRTSAGGSASLFRGTPRSRRWGRSDRRAGIGFEREIVIGLRPDLITVKDGPAIPVGHGESPEELLVHVLEALEQEARTWGPPPQGFYWIPSIRFLVSPGGNQHYARLRGPLSRWGVNSRVEQALDTSTPAFQPENGR